MSNIVERLQYFPPGSCEQDAAAEIERLRAENWQLKQACGYSIPADKETIKNPFKCGTCDAKSIELEELRADKAELLSLLRMTWPHVVSEGDDALASIITAIIAKVSK